MTRQGLRALRPTGPAGPVDDLAELDGANPTRDDGLDFVLGTLRGKKALGFWQSKRKGLQQGTRRAETVIVVTVLGLVPVTVGRTHVRRLIVERAATQHTANRSSPSGRRLYQEDRQPVDTCRPVVHGQANSSAVGEFRESTPAARHSLAASSLPGVEIFARCLSPAADGSEKFGSRGREYPETWEK